MKRRAFYLILIITVTMFTIFVPVIIAGFLYILSPQKVSIFTSFSLPCFITPGFFCSLSCISKGLDNCPIFVAEACYTEFFF